MLSVQHVNERLRRVLQPLYDIFAAVQLAFTNSLRHLLHALGSAVGKLERKEAFGTCLLHDQKSERAWPERRRFQVINK